MAEDTPTAEPPVETPVPTIAADDIPVDGVPAQNLDTPQKDTVMAEASNEHLAVSTQSFLVNLMISDLG